MFLASLSSCCRNCCFATRHYAKRQQNLRKLAADGGGMAKSIASAVGAGATGYVAFCPFGYTVCTCSAGEFALPNSLCSTLIIHYSLLKVKAATLDPCAAGQSPTRHPHQPNGSSLNNGPPRLPRHTGAASIEPGCGPPQVPEP